MSDGQRMRVLERLQAGAEVCACGHFLTSLDRLTRTNIYTALVFDRLERKMRVVTELHTEAQENWNQTLYLLYFRTLGDGQNQAPYLALARRVPYKIVLRERLVPQAIEAMFLGASGLLDLYPHDDYTLRLRRQFSHLAAKYDISPMEASVWNLAEIRPANHPVLRLAQAAEFFAQDEFLMHRTMMCRTEKEVQELFCVEASDYWRCHHTPGTKGDTYPKRLGVFKANIIGINLVAVLQFAYGSAMAGEGLRENAFSLLEALGAEQNRYIKAWQREGLRPSNAFETQALLQLSTEYCAAKRCKNCPVGRKILYRMTTPDRL